MSRRRRGGRQGRITLLRRQPEFVLRNDAATGGSIIIGYEAGVSTFGAAYVGTETGDGCGAFNVPFALVFKLSSLYSSPELTAIADRYMIDKVWIRCHYKMGTYNTTVPAAALAQNPAYPAMKWYNDYDDATPDTVAAINERMGLKYRVFAPGRFISMSCRPRFQVGTTEEEGSTSIVPARAQRGFIDSLHPDVPHYGIKGMLCGISLPDADDNEEFHGVRFDVVYRIILRDIA